MVKLVRTELALGVLGTSKLTSTQSLGWKGLSTESMLLPLVRTSLGGEPAYPISELSVKNEKKYSSSRYCGEEREKKVEKEKEKKRKKQTNEQTNSVRLFRFDRSCFSFSCLFWFLFCHRLENISTFYYDLKDDIYLCTYYTYIYIYRYTHMYV